MDARHLLDWIHLAHAQFIGGDGIAGIIGPQRDIDLVRVGRQVDLHPPVGIEWPREVRTTGVGFGRVGNWILVRVPCHRETDPQHLLATIHHVFRRAAGHFGVALELGRDCDLVAREENVGALAPLLEFLVALEIPDRPPARESLLGRDGGQAVALLDLALGSLAPFFLGQVLGAVAVPIGAVEIGEAHCENT